MLLGPAASGRVARLLVHGRMVRVVVVVAEVTGGRGVAEGEGTGGAVAIVAAPAPTPLRVPVCVARGGDEKAPSIQPPVHRRRGVSVAAGTAKTRC